MGSLMLGLYLVVAAQPPKAVSMEAFLVKQCEKGVEADCKELEALQGQLERQQRIQARASLYREKLNGDGPMVDEKTPNLAEAYPVVMQDHLESELNAGESLELNNDRLPGCAQHYHNHWINKKLWWPTNDNQEPEWASIYVFIVDHYYGFCLKS